MNKRDVLFFMMASIVWGATWIIIKGQVMIMSPEWSVFYRFLFALILMAILMILLKKSFFIAREAYFVILVFGFFQFFLNFNAVYISETFIVSGLVAILFSLLFIPNALFSIIFLGSRYSKNFYLGSIISILGIFLLFYDRLPSDITDQNVFIAGILFAILGVLSSSVANVLQASEIAKKQPLFALLFWSMCIGTLFNGTYAMIAIGYEPVSFSLSLIMGFLYLSLVGTVFAFYIYIELTRNIGAAKAAYTGIVIPIIAMTLSSIFDSFVWSNLSILGAFVGLIGMYLALNSNSIKR